MRITKELFNKLKPEKKKEFIERINKVRDTPLIYAYVTYFYWVAYFMAFMFLIFPLYKLAFGSEIIKSLLIIFIFGIKILFICILAGIGIDLMICILKLIKENEIKKDYFKIEVR